MKSFEEIIKQEPIYLNNWAQSKKFGLIADFESVFITLDEYNATSSPYPNDDVWEKRKKTMRNCMEKWKDVNILFASYGTGGYEGDAFVLLEKDGKLFEVNANHCSCYGLEGQFNPEETSLEVLQHRLVEGKLGQENYAGNEFGKELMQFIGV